MTRATAFTETLRLAAPGDQLSDPPKTFPNRLFTLALATKRIPVLQHSQQLGIPSVIKSHHFQPARLGDSRCVSPHHLHTVCIRITRGTPPLEDDSVRASSDAMLLVDGDGDCSVRFTVRNDAAQLDYVNYGGT